jgi:hypothetical protein
VLLSASCTFFVERGELSGGLMAPTAEVIMTAAGPVTVVLDHSSTITLPPVHVLFCLSGNHSGFLSEFEVSLKSVLMNAPLERNLTVHIMADALAYEALDDVFARAELELWQSRTQVSIESYNVEQHIPAWHKRVEDLFASTGFQRQPSHAFGVGLHTIGTWFRLFCHDVLKVSNSNDKSIDDNAVEHVLYIDPDVVIMANLEDVWRHADTEYHFQWGVSVCAGFLLLNVPKVNEIWQTARTLP